MFVLAAAQAQVGDQRIRRVNALARLPASGGCGISAARSGSGSKFDMQVEGGWTTGRMVERYCKARPFEERRKAPSPFTASRAAQKEKRPSQQRSGLDGNRAA